MHKQAMHSKSSSLKKCLIPIWIGDGESEKSSTPLLVMITFLTSSNTITSSSSVMNNDTLFFVLCCQDELMITCIRVTASNAYTYLPSYLQTVNDLYLPSSFKKSNHSNTHLLKCQNIVRRNFKPVHCNFHSR